MKVGVYRVSGMVSCDVATDDDVIGLQKALDIAAKCKRFGKPDCKFIGVLPKQDGEVAMQASAESG